MTDETIQRIALVLLIGLVCLSGSVAHAAEADTILGFADSLFREGDYRNAIHEYHRYLYHFPDGDQAVSVRFRIAAAHRNAGEVPAAISTYERLQSLSPRVKAYAQMELAETFLLAERRQDALDELKSLMEEDMVSDLWPRAQFLMAIAHMESKHWDQARLGFRSLVEQFPSSDFASVAGELAQMSQQGRNLPRHSPWFSGLLSAVVPGLGQVYNGRWSDGAYAFLVVGAFAGATAYYATEERHRISIPVGIVGLLFYAGDIYGGARAAHVYNAQHETSLLQRMRAHIRESDVFAPRPMTLSFRF